MSRSLLVIALLGLLLSSACASHPSRPPLRHSRALTDDDPTEEGDPQTGQHSEGQPTAVHERAEQDESPPEEVADTSGKPCHPDCTKKGNCNIEDGRCECMFGMTGEDCTVPLLPACQEDEKWPPFWGVFQPKNCECYKQAMDLFNCTDRQGRTKEDNCQNAIFQMRLASARCYTYQGVPATEQRSKVPDVGSTAVKWYNLDLDRETTEGREKAVIQIEIEEEKGRRAINLWNHDKCRTLPLDKCGPNECSHMGICIDSCDPEQPEKEPWCECHKGWMGWRGADCDAVDDSTCTNQCSNRGQCIRGFCHCQPGYFGLDCSRTKGYPARPDKTPPRHKLRIYMYELPATVSSPIELDDNLQDSVPIYESYLHFLGVFVKDWAVRTEDPWEANLFYIPSFTYSYSSNNGKIGPHVDSVVDYINRTYPWFSRNQGKDHFMWFTGDGGACNNPDSSRNLIKLVHFGLHINQGLQGKAKVGHYANDPIHGCYNPARDIVASPYNDLGLEDAATAYKKILDSNGTDPDRNILFFFAGGVRMNQHTYSGGVRQAIYKMLEERNQTHPEDLQDIVFMDGYVDMDEYRRLYNTAKFCLAPHGSGFGIRISISMVHGCIPVIIQDHVYQPFESVIRYEDMSVRIPKWDVPNLIPILRSISEEEIASMRLLMAQHYQAYIWDPWHGGKAYDYTIEALFKRLHQMWGELY